MRRTAIVIPLLMVLAGCYGGTRPPRIGNPAPDFTVQDSDRKLSLSDYKGKVVLLNFWATWCAPCIAEMPDLIALQEKMKDRGVVVVGVSIDADEDAYHKFLKDYKVNFVTVRDEERKTSTLYGTFGWPETYIIDRQGVVRRKFIGAADWTSPEIVGFLGKM